MRTVGSAVIALTLASATVVPAVAHGLESDPQVDERQAYEAKTQHRLEHAASEIDGADPQAKVYPSAEAALADARADWKRMQEAVGEDWRQAKENLAQSWQRLQQKVDELVTNAQE